MIELPEALLLGGTALVTHVGLMPDLIWYFRELPDGRWLRPWTQPGIFNPDVPRSGWNAWVGIFLGSTFIAVTTFFSGLLLIAGGYATVIGGLELVIAIAWFRYLLTGRPISRTGDKV